MSRILFSTLALLTGMGVAGTALAQTPEAWTARIVNPQGTQVGTARFTPQGTGVQLQVEVMGLPAGVHGMHIHQNGSCEPGPDAAAGSIVPFGAAGPHFDPRVSRNHGHPSDPPTEAHAGDLPVLLVGPDGRGSLQLTTDKFTLTPGDASVRGRSIVIHEKPDDYETDPSGNSGARIACGVIEPLQGPVVNRYIIPGWNIFPEGITQDPVTGTLFTGSASEGHLFRVLPSGKVEVLAEGGSPGRQSALGMKLDPYKRLWVAAGTTGMVAVVDSLSGQTLAVLKTPESPQAFINDLTVAGNHVYVTDSYRPVVFRTQLTGGKPRGLEKWLDLQSTPIRYFPGTNLNGIVAAGNSRFLLTIQSNTGQLWRIDVRTRKVQEVKVDGTLKNGDGLVLNGQSLYVVRNAESEIVKVDLNTDFTAGKVSARVSDPRMKFTTTATWTEGGLVVVNGQLDRQKNPPPLLPFDLVKVKVP